LFYYIFLKGKCNIIFSKFICLEQKKSFLFDNYFKVLISLFFLLQNIIFFISCVFDNAIITVFNFWNDEKYLTFGYVFQKNEQFLGLQLHNTDLSDEQKTLFIINILAR